MMRRVLRRLTRQCAALRQSAASVAPRSRSEYRGRFAAVGYSRLSIGSTRSEEHTSELQSRLHLVCRLLLEKKIQSATSRQHTTDQVYAQNEMLAYQQKESTARVASIMDHTNLSKQQQVSEIMRQMLTQAQTAGQYFTNDQIKEMTRKVSAEVDLVHHYFF